MNGSKYPKLITGLDMSAEDIDKRVLVHAKHFAVLQFDRGGWNTKSGSNWIRREAPSLAEARELARKMHEVNGKKAFIHAVADFAGALNTSRQIETYPVGSSEYITSAQRKKMLKAQGPS